MASQMKMSSLTTETSDEQKVTVDLDDFEIKTIDQMREEIEQKMEMISESVGQAVDYQNDDQNDVQNDKNDQSVQADLDPVASTLQTNEHDVSEVCDVMDLSSIEKKELFMELLPLTQLPDDPSYIKHEEMYMKTWNANADKKLDLYSRMIEKNKGKPEYVFMDGPPFVSGNLHPGHITVGSVKSAIHIYKIMKGMFCVVKLGYDCHGLPAVNKTAAENDLDTLDKIREVGLAKFNKMCEQMIFKYSKSWTPLIQRIGRFADFDDVYMTRNKDYMETCIWIFKQLWEKGLVYKGNKVMAYSYGNQTPLSNFEAAQNYHEKETKSIYVRFKIHRSEVIDEPVKETDKNIDEKTDEKSSESSESSEYLVAWTTTPWTLPMNLALCVNAEVEYVKITVDDDKNVYILGKKSIHNLYSKKQKIKILDTVKGSDLVGLCYEPMFPFTTKIDQSLGSTREYKVVSDPYVTEGDTGSAIVHIAPAFGDDDFRVCSANNLIDNQTVSNYCPIDESGRFTDVIEPYKGRLVFETEDDIRAHLKKTGDLLKIQMYKHNYPFCWRTETPLIYCTVPSYYIRVTALKDRLIELNRNVNWYPREIGENRFHQWLSNVKDWAVSRSTSYATPIMLWISEDGEDTICVGSIDELEQLSGKKVTNLHPEFVNDIVIEKNEKMYRRIPDTFDCWFESGAVPFGQLHYPFNPDSKVLESREFLSDFICEGMDQTRGWFYTLFVLSVAILDRAPYKNVMCTGMILDKDGRKYAKKFGNFVDPMVSINEFGADVLRTYFIDSPVISADCLKFNEELIGRLKRRFTPYINGVKFWIEHTLNFTKQKTIKDLKIQNIDRAKLTSGRTGDYSEFSNLFDRWILMRTDQLVKSVTVQMDSFALNTAVDLLLDFIEDLTNWYIKFNRDRLKGLGTEKDWSDSIKVLYNVLMTYCRLWAPFMPFLSEHIYQHLRVCSEEFSKIDSVMLTDYPVNQEPVNQEPLTQESKTDSVVNTLNMFKDIQRVCFMVRGMRDSTSTHSKMVIPLKSCTIYHDDANYLELLKLNLNLVQSELNCQTFNFETLHDNVTVKIEPDRKTIGSFFRKEAHLVLKLIESQTEEFLCKVYDGEETFRYESSQFNEMMDQRFYALTRVPKMQVSRQNYLCRIDKDLMVGIDHQYDESIHYQYQLKRLHIMVQNARKMMKVRPWNKVTVILDILYATNTLKNELCDSLTNADVVIGDFSEDDTYRNLQGLQDSAVHLLYGEEFCWENMPGDVSSNGPLVGRVIVHFHKLSQK